MKLISSIITRKKTAASHHRHSISPPLFEPLEVRQLLSVDLSGAFGVLPSQALSGSVLTTTLQIHNTGTTRAAGTLAVKIYAIPSGESFDAASADLLTTLRPSISIKAGGTNTKNASIPLGALPAGNYQIVAFINSNNHFKETGASNNLVESGDIHVTLRHVDLTSNIQIKTMPTVFAGVVGHSQARVTVTNLGPDAAAAGQTVPISIVMRPVGAVDSSQDVVLSAKNSRISIGNLASGASRTVTVPLTFPATLDVGSFNIVESVNASGIVTETDTLNDNSTLPQTLIVKTAPQLAAGAGSTAVTLPTPILPPEAGPVNAGSTSIDGTLSFPLPTVPDLTPTINSSGFTLANGDSAVTNSTLPSLVTVAPVSLTQTTPLNDQSTLLVPVPEISGM